MCLLCLLHSLAKLTSIAAGAFGGAIAFGVGHLNGVHGLQGWRWLFILEGAPSCVCAVFVFYCFPDFPETSKWLSDNERTLAVERLEGVASLGHANITWADAKATLLDGRLYLHHVLCMSFSVAFSSISLFAPTIVSGLGYEGLAAQLFTVPPYGIGFVVTLFVAWQSDKHQLRSWAAFSCFMAAGVSFLVAGNHASHWGSTPFIDWYLRNLTRKCLQSAVRATMCRGAFFLRDKCPSVQLAHSKYAQYRCDYTGNTS